jgi:hypothetical protein
LRAGVWELPARAGMPWGWVAAAYFFGILAAGWGFRRHALASRHLLMEGALLIVLFLAPPLWSRHELGLTLGTTLFLTARLGFFRVPGDVGVALAVGAADAVFEGGLLACGLFRYRNCILPEPLWLFPLWASMALSMRRLAARLTL